MSAPKTFYFASRSTLVPPSPARTRSKTKAFTQIKMPETGAAEPSYKPAVTVPASRPAVTVHRAALPTSKPAVNVPRAAVSASKPAVTVPQPVVLASRPVIAVPRAAVPASKPAVTVSKASSRPAAVPRPVVLAPRPLVTVPVPRAAVTDLGAFVPAVTVAASRPAPSVTMAASRPPMTAAASRPPMTAAASRPAVNAPASRPAVTVAGLWPAVTVATSRPLLTAAASRPVVTAAASRPVVTAATSRPAVNAAAKRPAVIMHEAALVMIGPPVLTIDMTEDTPGPNTSRSAAPTIGSISCKPWSSASAIGNAAITTPATIVRSTSNSRQINNESLASTSGKRICVGLDQSSSAALKDLTSSDNVAKVEPFQFVKVEDTSEPDMKKIKTELREECSKMSTVEKRSVRERKILKAEISTLTKQITHLQKQSVQMKAKLKTIKIENLKLNKLLVDMESKNKAANKIIDIRKEKIDFLTKKNMDLEKKNVKVKELAAQILEQ